MIEFVGRMEMLFIATSDGRGECDASLRAGPPGFLLVLDDRTLAYPEYRGNGVLASLGNIAENPHIGLLMIDFVEDLIGLHVNGRARVVEDDTFRAQHPGHGRSRPGGAGRAAGRALGAGRRARGLHPLPQAHPAGCSGCPRSGTGAPMTRPQGRRLLRRPGRPARPAT